MTALVGLALILNVGTSLWEDQSPTGVIWSSMINLVAVIIHAAPVLSDRRWIHVRATVVILGALVFALFTQGRLL